MRSTLLLDALACKNESRPPVWFMRQAGRYLPQYRALREKWSLRELFLTPELAAQITKLPVDLLGVDAAILFSDITVVALALGLKLDFKEGPVITGAINKRETREELASIAEAISLVKPELSVPLIGFCGGPFTVASYIYGSVDEVKKKMFQDPLGLKGLLEAICDVSIEYLSMQVEAGVDAVQVFDSWANVLSKEEFLEFCAPYLKKIVAKARVPVILFMRGASIRVNELVAIGPSCISFDWQKPLSEMEVPMALQGNLDPDLLYAPQSVIRQKTQALLSSMREHKGFIVNLGHGLKPDMDPAAVRCIVETVQNARFSTPASYSAIR